ncbi:MAG: rod shape-determining protein MreD [Clostridia bacterium]|nr:rod shape-determining protein MreD [Clostridia bacterium]
MTIETQNKKLIIRRICLALILLLLSVLQNGDGLFPQFFGVRALLLIPCVVCIAMYERDVWGMLFGLFAGALWDIFASGASFNALFLLFIGFGCGSLINTVMRSNIVTATLLSFVSTLIYNVIYWIFHFVIPQTDSIAFMFLRYYLPGIIYTTVLTPILFLIVRAIEKKFTEEY